MARRVPFPRLGLLCVVMATACSMFSGLDQLEIAAQQAGGPDAAATTDGPASAPSGPNDSEAPPVTEAGADARATPDSGPLRVNDSFESGAGCNGWEVENGTASPGAPGFAGARSCSVCPTENQVASIHKYLPVENGSWILSARVHGTAAAGPTSVFIGGFDTTTDDVLGESEVTVNDAWKFLQATFATQATTGTTALELFLEGFGNGQCFLVDEVKLERAPRGP